MTAVIIDGVHCAGPRVHDGSSTSPERIRRGGQGRRGGKGVASTALLGGKSGFDLR